MNRKSKNYQEAELVQLFGLEKTKIYNPLLKKWLETTTVLDEIETRIFEDIFDNAFKNIDIWNEEDLKMNFISFVLYLSGLKSDSKAKFQTYFEKNVEAEVEGTFLKVKTDFMVAKGIMDMPQNPYFHFQEYKRQTDPNGNAMAQLLEAFLIAQTKNTKPIYGCCVVGKYWEFVIMHHKTYCVSASYDATKHADLMQIIAILRHFKYILETELLD